MVLLARGVHIPHTDTAPCGTKGCVVQKSSANKYAQSLAYMLSFSYLCPATTIDAMMISVEVDANESIDRALKRFRKKYEKAGIMRKVRGRVAYVKPSIRRRERKLRSLYRHQLVNEAK